MVDQGNPSNQGTKSKFSPAILVVCSIEHTTITEPGWFFTKLFKAGCVIVTADLFQSSAKQEERGKDVEYFTSNNRTDTAWQVQDILTLIMWI